MVWYKSWLDTQRWFLLALMFPLAQVLALYMSYPLDPATSFPNGALGVSPAEMTLVRLGDFRSYVWCGLRAQPPERLHDLRARRDQRGSAIHRDGVRRGRDPPAAAHDLAPLRA